MAPPTDSELVLCHKNGVGLGRTWIVYATPDLKAKWGDLQNQSALDVAKHDMETAAKLNGDTAEKLAAAFGGANAIWQARGNLEKQLKAKILNYVQQGHLHGFGYETPRRVASAPVAIPKEAWAGQCDWRNGTLRFRGLEFVDVRLTTNRIRNDVLQRGTVEIPPAKSAGRPSVAPAIEAAFHALQRAGQIDPSASQTSHFPKLRKWLELNNPDLPVPPAHMSDKTISKYFSSLFNALKKSSNL